MGNIVMQYTCCLIILTICIDQGDGRWKEKDRRNLRHDIELYERMGEKIEREIEAFYDEYPDERLKGDHVDRIHYKYMTNTRNPNAKTKAIERFDGSEHKENSSYSPSDINNSPTKYELKLGNYDSSPKLNVSNSEWPKFDEILLAIGKKYDWKNDRWIKVKEKFKKSKVRINNKIKIDNRIDIHEKHKFSYRIVKLKSKNRRSVVVAVSAVR